jgi:hypothetical protein
MFYIYKKNIMKKASLILTILVSFFFSSNLKAQTNEAFYSGKWNIIVLGTPYGDVKMGFVIEKKEGKYSGIVQDSTGVEISKISSIEEAGKSITISYNAMGYDLSVQLEPADDDNLKGVLNNMFDTKGIRVKETK